MAIVDMLDYNANLSEVTTEASTVNSSYAATYWPWLQTQDPNSGQQVWVPASTMIPSVYAFNDASTEPWFAPAGINRGTLPTVIKAERILTQGNRDTLYEANVNPIATFPNSGVSVFGQKTLQKKKSSLDRVNVRRLLIELKTNIKQIADTLVFEQNTVATRNEFLTQVNPYLSSVQQRQGLNSYRVVMDDTNNTPTTIDNNQLIGAIYIQPVKTAEFIVLDFNVTSTGVTFE
jgi:phage tail sheath protein FI